MLGCATALRYRRAGQDEMKLQRSLHWPEPRVLLEDTEGRGVMSQLLQACERRQWQLTELTADPRGEPLGAAPGHSGVMLTLAGNGILNAPNVLAGIDGVLAIRQLDEDPD